MYKNSCIKKILCFVLLLFILSITGCNSGYEITLLLDDGEVYKILNVKDGENLTVEAPKKEGYTFEGWFNGSIKVEENTNFNQDTTLNAKFIINKYTYKFVVDGEIIKEEVSDYGSEIVFPTNPKKADDVENKYTFEKWDNEAKTLLKDEVYNAIFTSEKRSYEYIFMNDDGTIIKEETAVYGSNIVYPANPTKEETDEFKYEFSHWDSDAQILTEDIVIIAVYTSIKKQYTYKFVDEDGTVLKEEVVDYGTMPVEPEDIPSKPQTTESKFVFIGWDKDIEMVTGDVVYKAKYSTIPINVSLDNKIISILGDSISTFYAEGSEMNSYYGGDNQFYYPRYSSTIKTVDKTWWYQLIKNTNMKLGINNSWSGSCAVGSGASAGVSDQRINTINENGNPDIVIIYLGTNDCASGFEVNAFKNAIELMVTKVRKLGDSQIFITTLGYSNYTGSKYKEETRLAYNEAIRDVALNMGCGIVPLDEYIVEDSYMFYLQDFLHYNADGAKLLSKIFEKSIKEYNNIEFNEEIKVQHKEKLPEGVLGLITATASSGFWTGYGSNVYLMPASSSENPTFSLRIEISKNDEDNKYYVTNILKSGETGSYNSDYVLIISDSHEQSKSLLDGLSQVVVGSLVEFNTSLQFPVELTFKEGDGSISGETPNPGEDEEIEEGKLKVGAYNEGVWTKYETTVIIYTQDKIDQGSLFSNFYIIKLTKDVNSDNYLISGLKNVDDSANFDQCDYYVLIYRDLEVKSYYENAKIGDSVTIEGDVTTGSCYLIFN